eukprot:3247849-Rhodomonas_salina.2
MVPSVLSLPHDGAHYAHTFGTSIVAPVSLLVHAPALPNFWPLAWYSAQTYKDLVVPGVTTAPAL